MEKKLNIIKTRREAITGKNTHRKKKKRENYINK